MCWRHFELFICNFCNLLKIKLYLHVIQCPSLTFKKQKQENPFLSSVFKNLFQGNYLGSPNPTTFSPPTYNDSYDIEVSLRDKKDDKIFFLDTFFNTVTPFNSFLHPHSSHWILLWLFYDLSFSVGRVNCELVEFCGGTTRAHRGMSMMMHAICSWRSCGARCLSSDLIINLICSEKRKLYVCPELVVVVDFDQHIKDKRRKPPVLMQLQCCQRTFQCIYFCSTLHTYFPFHTSISV